ncbi:MAG: GntR family transcriptional regulator [Blastocatellia bacterium]
MIQWFVDKASKMPLYLQLKDQIEYYISTGAIKENHQLPPVYELAETLGINFETVRKAYKELQQEGLISMKRGQGTFITLHSTAREKRAALLAEKTDLPDLPALAGSIRHLVGQARRLGTGREELQQMVAQAWEEAVRENRGPVVIFTECNQLQVREISAYLNQHLQMQVEPVLLDELGAAISACRSDGCRQLHLITTGFHINEVRATIEKLAEQTGNLVINLDVLITNMSPETRRQIDALGQDARIGFICRDPESAQLYRDLLRVELDNSNLNLTCCTLAEQELVQDLYRRADLLLVSPPVFEEVRRSAPPRIPVLNVFDRVDPMSLRVIRDRLVNQDNHN